MFAALFIFFFHFLYSSTYSVQTLDDNYNNDNNNNIDDDRDHLDDDDDHPQPHHSLPQTNINSNYHPLNVYSAMFVMAQDSSQL